jgi:hypothetical protein
MGAIVQKSLWGFIDFFEQERDRRGALRNARATGDFALFDTMHAGRIEASCWPLIEVD